MYIYSVADFPIFQNSHLSCLSLVKIVFYTIKNFKSSIMQCMHKDIWNRIVMTVITLVGMVYSILLLMVWGTLVNLLNFPPFCIIRDIIYRCFGSITDQDRRAFTKLSLGTKQTYLAVICHSCHNRVSPFLKII